MKELIVEFIGLNKALLTWFHAAHHVTKGTGFSADHVSLFGEIYEEIGDIFDESVEKSIVLCDSEDVACPIVLSSISSQIIGNIQSPVGKSSDEIAMIALDLVRKHIQSIEYVYNTLSNNRYLTLGMDDFLASTSGKFEKFEYLLGQRVKKGY